MKQQMKKVKFESVGMSCSSCEVKIKEALKKLEGVQNIKTSYEEDTLEFTYDEQIISLDEIRLKVEQLGYQIVENKKSNYFTIGIGIIILAFYLIIKNTIGFNFIPSVSSNMGYGILFVIGLLTSLHCIAMCGGINLSVCMAYSKEQKDNSRWSKFMPSILYNGGRVVSYTIIGGMIGALGAVFSISNTGRAIVTVGAGIFMIIMGLNMLNLFPWLRKINPHIPKIFAEKVNQRKSGKGPFIVGLLNGFMPCGPLQAMQLYALGTGSFLAGAFSMFVFSIGTVPLLFAFGALGSMLNAKATKGVLKVSAVLVMVLGIVMLNRGVAFTGFSFDAFAKQSDSTSFSNEETVGNKGKEVEENKTKIEDGIQVIKTELNARSYPAIQVQKGMPVEWTIHVSSENLNGCNNKIIIPQYNIEQALSVGDNTISFVPRDAGTFGYSCWMGMIRSSITVDEQEGNDIQKENESQTESTEESVDNTGIPEGCCGL